MSWLLKASGHHQVADHLGKDVEQRVSDLFNEFITKVRNELPHAGVMNAEFHGSHINADHMANAMDEVRANRSPGQHAAAAMGAIADDPVQPANRPQPNPAVIAEGSAGEDATAREEQGDNPKPADTGAATRSSQVNPQQTDSVVAGSTGSGKVETDQGRSLPNTPVRK